VITVRGIPPLATELGSPEGMRLRTGLFFSYFVTRRRPSGLPTNENAPACCHLDRKVSSATPIPFARAGDGSRKAGSSPPGDAWPERGRTVKPWPLLVVIQEPWCGCRLARCALRPSVSGRKAALGTSVFILTTGATLEISGTGRWLFDSVPAWPTIRQRAFGSNDSKDRHHDHRSDEHRDPSRTRRLDQTRTGGHRLRTDDKESSMSGSQIWPEVWAVIKVGAPPNELAPPASCALRNALKPPRAVEEGMSPWRQHLLQLAAVLMAESPG